MPLQFNTILNNFHWGFLHIDFWWLYSQVKMSFSHCMYVGFSSLTTCTIFYQASLNIGWIVMRCGIHMGTLAWDEWLAGKSIIRGVCCYWTINPKRLIELYLENMLLVRHRKIISERRDWNFLHSVVVGRNKISIPFILMLITLIVNFHGMDPWPRPEILRIFSLTKKGKVLRMPSSQNG